MNNRTVLFGTRPVLFVTGPCFFGTGPCFLEPDIFFLISKILPFFNFFFKPMTISKNSLVFNIIFHTIFRDIYSVNKFYHVLFFYFYFFQTSTVRSPPKKKNAISREAIFDKYYTKEKIGYSDHDSGKITFIG